MIPARYAPIVFGFILSGMMSFLVSGISTVLSMGMVSAFWGQWILAWLPSWAVAFPIVLIVAPIARRLVGKITSPEG
ncbi:MAG: DUF2798 domain-containing protein [Pseudomonadota bacterium]